MNVIGIVGSPRNNGNTDTLVQAVLDGSKEAGYKTTKYNLNDMKYTGCQACNYCKSHDHCRLDDDVSKLLEDIKQADAVVFGSPIYFFQFTGQFRLMEDRMFSLIDKDFKSRVKPGKKAVIITSQGDPNAESFDGVLNEFKKVLTLLGFEVIDSILMVGGHAKDAVMERPDLMDKAKADGMSF